MYTSHSEENPMNRDLGSVVAASTVLVALLSDLTCLAETVVLPVVARGVAGLNGSVWDSEVRILGPGRFLPGPVRRLWVALPEGGFVDDPATAPQWRFPLPTCPDPCLPLGIVVLTGDQLLQGTNASKGAVALEIEGTGSHVFLRNSNTLGQPRLPQDDEGLGCCLPGNGQLIRALAEPLVGQGLIPWITSGRSPYRVSVGVINPTAQARTITIELEVAGQTFPLWPPGQAGTYWLQTSSTTLAIDLPPWGFRQVDNLASVLLQECPLCEGLDRVAPAAIYLLDNGTQSPFYAYASVIWTPLNDPEFIAAVPMTP
jgi:hypothetical protein